ncbi:MAG: serine/threonine-protein phosphatase [Rhodocyclaceae bacterium]|nr:serine/threonine-protein phosphatase [Rhodocyclaceae bacterium]
MRFTVSHDSRLGKRQMNQDRLAWAHTDEALLLVLCDGMGGHRHGEIAAQIVVDHCLRVFKHAARPRLDDPHRFLSDSLLDAHWAINNYASLRAIPLDDAPRTTCVACVIQDSLATIAHTGDSRVYLIRNGQTHTRTYDHSRVQMLIDSGELTEEQAQHHPQRNLVITCLGGDVPPRIDVAQAIRLEAADTIALCSDGVWGPLGEQLSAGLVYPLERAIPTLLDRAEVLAGPSCDNLSLIALRWESESGRPQIDEKTGALTGQDTLIEDFTRTLPRPLTEQEIAGAIATVKNQLASTHSFKPASPK